MTGNEPGGTFTAVADKHIGPELAAIQGFPSKTLQTKTPLNDLIFQLGTILLLNGILLEKVLG